MKVSLENALNLALQQCMHDAVLSLESPPSFTVERTQDIKKGHFATNIALVLAKPCRMAPAQIAELILERLDVPELCQKIDIAGPGFINFYLHDAVLQKVILEALTEKHNFGCCNFGKHKKIHMEFVSSNPTGPLHVGHGRSAASGATIANLLDAVGFEVYREYYVNDAGRQMAILAASVWLRYLALFAEPIVFPDNGYRGEYVIAIAEICAKKMQDAHVFPWTQVSKDLPLDESAGGDKEIYIDAIIDRMKALLGIDAFQNFHQIALRYVLDDIKNDLAEMGVVYDNWFSEQSLVDSGACDTAIAALKASGNTFTQDHALWFKSTDFGDEKDRVLVRANGQKTYFATDSAYHWSKYQRGFQEVIDLFGSDHHGYIPRIKAVVRALGHDSSQLKILILQFAVLYRGKERVQMSTRSGSFVTLRELRHEVGNDATRFFYVMRKLDQHVDFDLELAKSRSNENPVYYIQYAHARICSVIRQMQERNFNLENITTVAELSGLTSEHEIALIILLGKYPEVILQAATQYEPHMLAFFLKELATALHSYYNAQQLLCADSKLRSQRVYLVLAVAQVIKNGLTLLGVSSPEIM